jgi:DNA polymerase III subunit delta'
MVYPWNSGAFKALLERQGRLPHALLLRGRDGIGKLACAEALARALLCERPAKDGSACGHCTGCAWMGQGSHPDFRRLEPENLAAEQGDAEQGGERKASVQIPVEQVRELAGFINLSSHRGGAKVVLIHPAEALNVNAANALLKNLEEPPPNCYFLLVAHRWHQLLPTLRSRCEQVVLPLPGRKEARDWLVQQKVGNADLALAQAGGAPLLALRFDEEYWGQREAFLKAITGSRFDALRVAEEFRETSPALIVGWLQKLAFDLACHQATGENRYNPDLAAAVATISAGLDRTETVRFLRHLVQMQRIVSHPLNARLFLEQLLLSYSALLHRRQGLAA